MITFKICSFIKNNSLFFIVLSCLTVFCWLFFFTYLAVPFFKLLCQDTGPNGVYGVFLDFKKHNIFFQIFVDYIVLLKNKIYWFNFGNQDKHDGFLINQGMGQKKLRFVDISVVFKINDHLPLIFDSSSVKHKISVGSPQLTFCTVKNDTSIDIVFTSIYNVYPSEALPHLEKIQCFCYDDQLVESKSTLYLPIYYKLSSNFYEDPLMSNVSDITVSYSIFKS